MTNYNSFQTTAGAGGLSGVKEQIWSGIRSTLCKTQIEYKRETKVGTPESPDPHVAIGCNLSVSIWLSVAHEDLKQ